MKYTQDEIMLMVATCVVLYIGTKAPVLLFLGMLMITLAFRHLHDIGNKVKELHAYLALGTFSLISLTCMPILLTK